MSESCLRSGESVRTTELEKGSATGLLCGGAFCVSKRVGQSQHCEEKKGTESGRHDNSYYDRERRVRRCFGEVIITCYQMTVLARRGAFNEPQPLCSRTVADVFAAGSENEKGW